MHKVAILSLSRILSMLSDPFTILALLLFFSSPSSPFTLLKRIGKLATTLHKAHGREALIYVIGWSSQHDRSVFCFVLNSVLLFSDMGLALIISVAQALESGQALPFAYPTWIALVNQSPGRKMSWSYSLSAAFKKVKNIIGGCKDSLGMLVHDFWDAWRFLVFYTPTMFELQIHFKSILFLLKTIWDCNDFGIFLNSLWTCCRKLYRFSLKWAQKANVKMWQLISSEKLWLTKT